MIFGLLFTGLTVMIAYGFARDSLREECGEDERYKAMMQVSLAIMILVGLSGLYLFILFLAACFKQCQARCKRRKEVPELSSDEEDDKHFLLATRASSNRDANATNPATEQSRNHTDSNMLLSQIRGVFGESPPRTAAAVRREAARESNAAINENAANEIAEREAAATNYYTVFDARHNMLIR